MKTFATCIVLLLFAPFLVLAQKPDTVFFEHLTFDEIRDSIKGGARNVIVPTGAMEDGGAYTVLGASNQIANYAAGKIARTVGNTLVAPILPYGPQGNPEQLKPGAISVPDYKGFQELLEAAANSMKGSGFKNIILIGDSEEAQISLKLFSERINTAWKGSGVQLLYVPDYYVKTRADQEKYIADKMGIKDKTAGAAVIGAAQAMFINPQSIRFDKLQAAGADLSRVTPQLGQALLNIKIDNAVAQIRELMAQAAK